MQRKANHRPKMGSLSVVSARLTPRSSGGAEVAPEQHWSRTFGFACALAHRREESWGFSLNINAS